MKLSRVTLLLVTVVACGRGADEELTARGTVEVREVNIAPIAAGRLITVRAEEGAAVAVGDTLAVLSAPTLAADAEAAVARVASLRAVLRDLEAGSDPQEIAKAEAELAAKEADAARLAKDRDRLRVLLDAATAAAVAAAQVLAAREVVSLRRAGPRRDRILAARADVAQAEAVLSARRATNADFVLLAPIRGIVLARLAEPGDLVPLGGAIMRLGAMELPWVRIFVPARVLTRLAIGDSAAIYPPGAGGAVAGKEGHVEDSASRASPFAPVAGRIIAINPRAEFVTRTALTEDERADLLFGVKVAILDTTGRLKPGMPATVRLFPRGTAP